MQLRRDGVCRRFNIGEIGTIALLERCWNGHYEHMGLRRLALSTQTALAHCASDCYIEVRLDERNMAPVHRIDDTVTDIDTYDTRPMGLRG